MERPKSWITIISQALLRGHFTQQDKAEAADWATCAIGEKRSTRSEYVRQGGFDVSKPIDPMDSGALPVTVCWGDEPDGRVSEVAILAPYFWLELNHNGPGGYLDQLGIDFMVAVKNDRPHEALHIFAQITEGWDQYATDEAKRKESHLVLAGKKATA